MVAVIAAATQGDLETPEPRRWLGCVGRIYQLVQSLSLCVDSVNLVSSFVPLHTQNEQINNIGSRLARPTPLFHR